MNIRENRRQVTRISAVVLLMGVLVLFGVVACGGPAEPAAEPVQATDEQVETRLNAPQDYLTPGRVTFTGSGEAADTLEILVDGTVAGETTVGSDGTWSFETRLSEVGDYFVSARESEGTATESIVVSVIEVPTLDKVAEQHLVAGNLVLSGAGQPGLTLEILIDGEIAGETVIEADGRWTFAADLSQAGTYQLGVRAYTEDGTLLDAEAQAELMLREPAAPTLKAPADLALGEATLSGEGEPGWGIRVFGGDRLLGTAVVTEDGTWTMPIKLLRMGEYPFRAVSISPSGRLALSAPLQTHTIGARVAEEAVSAEAPEAAVATSTDLALLTTSADLIVGENLLIGRGEPGTAVEITVDDEVLDTVEVSEDGRWTLLFNVSEEGAYAVSLRAVDPNGENEDTPVQEVLHVGTSAEAPPTLDVPDEMLAGSVDLAGTAAPGATVQIRIDGTAVGEARATEEGGWQYTAEIATAGHYAISVASLDSDGAVLALSEGITVAVLEEADAVQATRTVDEELAANTADPAEAQPAEETEDRDPCADPVPGEDLGNQYVVGECEWITKIAERLGINYLAIIEANPELEDPADLMPGMIINLPERN